ncbi:MAG: hypothetical protein PVI21_02860 [Candidatus Woesebacteria bacterium]|jgi:hypothetical protein
MNDQSNNDQDAKQNTEPGSFYQPQPSVQPQFESTRAVHNAGSQKADSNKSLAWSAPEYVHNDKGFGWLVGLFITAVVIVAVAVWLQVWTFVVLAVVMTIAFGVVAFRPPKTLNYILDSKGVQVDKKLYVFSDFRAFGVLGEGSFYTVMLIPTKRFMPSLGIHFSEDLGEKIVDIIGAQLPQEELHYDVVEKTMRRLHF